jgi:hypothetical protein
MKICGVCKKCFKEDHQFNLFKGAFDIYSELQKMRKKKGSVMRIINHGMLFYGIIEGLLNSVV